MSRSRVPQRLVSAVLAVLLGSACLLGLASPASAATTARLTLPFTVGQVWYVCQGYATSEVDHVGNQANALDLALGPAAAAGTYGCTGPTNASQGQPVTAPAAGTIAKFCCRLPVDDMACLKFDSGGSALIGHMSGMPAVGTRVAAGVFIGRLNAPGTTTNDGGFSHIHVAAYASADCTGASVPFDDAHNTRFACAPDLPSSGAAHQYYRAYLSRCGFAARSGSAQIVAKVTVPGISAIGSDNKAPLHGTRSMTVDLYRDTQLVASKTQPATYSSASGAFTTTFDLGTGLAPGYYLVKVRMPNVLTQTLGQYSGTPFGAGNGFLTTPPQTPLFSGDINGDGKFDILDYNILMNCWRQSGCAAGSAQYMASDLNDDGPVNQVDYNIWLRVNAAVGKNCTNGLCVYNTYW